MEAELFDQSARWSGTWDMKRGAVHMSISGWDLFVCANRESAMHGGISIYENNPWAYYMLVNVR